MTYTVNCIISYFDGTDKKFSRDSKARTATLAAQNLIRDYRADIVRDETRELGIRVTPKGSRRVVLELIGEIKAA